MSKKIEYATNKWEKRKDSILDHEMARFKKIEELLDYQEKEKKTKVYVFSMLGISTGFGSIRDCISFNEALNNRIVSIRKFKLDYYICVDFWSLGLIRYAEQCGMTVDRNKYIEADLDYIGL